MSIWIPKNPGEAIDMARLLSPNNAQDLVILHAAFGRFFDGDMGTVLTQSFMIKGTPGLKADALAGICRRSGLCRFIRVTTWDDQRCVVEMARTDEPEAITHHFEFTMQMAQQMQINRGRQWQTMPKTMLHKRALSFGLRAVFPDALGSLYSVDELADAKDMSADERDHAIARSLGEDAPSRAPRAQRHSAPPRQQSQPPQPPQQHRKIERPANRLHDFSSLEGMQKAVEAWGVDPMEASNATEERCPKPPSQLETHEREFFFYSAIASDHVRTNNAVVEGWWRAPLNQLKPHHEAVAEQFPVLKFMLPKSFGPKLPYGAFMETLRVTNEAHDDLRDKLLAILDQMEATDWSAYDYAVNLVEEFKAHANA
jgi:hypothetical protein